MYFQRWRSSKDNQYYWRLRADNHEIVAHGEGYKNAADRDHAIDLVKSTNADTPVHDT